MNLKDVKLFIGPVSKNVVKSVIKYCNNNNKKIGLIPSRRQIDYNSGYVGWKTWFVAVILNQAWMVRIEVGATDLSPVL